MPQDEIARHLGSNRNALYRLTHDTRKRVKQGLEEVAAVLPRPHRDPRSRLERTIGRNHARAW